MQVVSVTQKTVTNFWLLFISVEIGLTPLIENFDGHSSFRSFLNVIERKYAQPRTTIYVNSKNRSLNSHRMSQSIIDHKYPLIQIFSN